MSKIERDVKEDVVKLAESFGKIEFDDKNVAHLPEGIYEKSLEAAGLDLKTVKAVQDHNGTFVAAAGLALGEAGTAYLKKNKKVESVSLAPVKLGRDELESTFIRSKTYPNRTGGEGAADIVKYGVLQSAYTTNGSTNKGQLKKVRKYLNDLAADALG